MAVAVGAACQAGFDEVLLGDAEGEDAVATGVAEFPGANQLAGEASGGKVGEGVGVAGEVGLVVGVGGGEGDEEVGPGGAAGGVAAGAVVDDGDAYLFGEDLDGFLELGAVVEIEAAEEGDEAEGVAAGLAFGPAAEGAFGGGDLEGAAVAVVDGALGGPGAAFAGEPGQEALGDRQDIGGGEDLGEVGDVGHGRWSTEDTESTDGRGGKWLAGED